jgi:hypothetical protein
MWIDKELIPYYLKVLKAESIQAENAIGIFADHNGCVNLSMAIETFEENPLGLEHTEFLWQQWNAISTLSKDVLKLEGLSDEHYGQILKIYWFTNINQFVNEVENMNNKFLKNSSLVQDKVKWLQYVLDIHH